MAQKVRKATILYNGFNLDVYEVPNGEIRLSKRQVSGAIGKHGKSLDEFLSGTSPQALPFKGIVFDEYEIDGSNFSIQSVPIKIAGAYWTYWSGKGNTTAQALCSTSVEESILRLAKRVLGYKIDEDQMSALSAQNMDSNEKLFVLIQMMETMGSQLGELKVDIHNLKNENLRLSGYKEDIKKNYPQFSTLLAVAQNEIEDDEYLDGISCLDYVLQNKIPLASSAYCTLRRRTAQYYRSTKGSNPKQSGSTKVYFGKDVAFIVATMRLILSGL
jgi:hypothetical protein